MKTFCLIFILISFSSCQEKEIIIDNVASMEILDMKEKRIDFKMLNDFYINSSKTKKFENYEIYGKRGSDGNMYNWNPKQKLLYIGEAFGCKTSGLSGVYFGLDSIKIKELIQLNVKIDQYKTLDSLLINTSQKKEYDEIIVSSFNSKVCNGLYDSVKSKK